MQFRIKKESRDTERSKKNVGLKLRHTFVGKKKGNISTGAEENKEECPPSHSMQESLANDSRELDEGIMRKLSKVLDSIDTLSVSHAGESSDSMMRQLSKTLHDIDKLVDHSQAPEVTKIVSRISVEMTTPIQMKTKVINSIVAFQHL
jgi:hypothetical protein